MYVKVPPESRRQRKPLPPRHNAFCPVFTEKKKGAAPLNWRLALRVLMRGIGIASFVMVVLGLMSGTIRSYVSMLIDRQVARAWPFTYAVVGDSLAAECPWKWSFGLSPLAVTNLAVRGADIRDITQKRPPGQKSAEALARARAALANVDANRPASADALIGPGLTDTRPAPVDVQPRQADVPPRPADV